MKRFVVLGSMMSVAASTVMSCAPSDNDLDPRLGSARDPLRRSCPLAYADVRVAVDRIPADGLTKVAVFTLARAEPGIASREEMVLGVDRVGAGTIAPSPILLGPMGSTTSFTPCNGLANPGCLGPFRITMARASNPTVIVARTPTLTLVEPPGVGSATPCLTGGNVAFLDGDPGEFLHPGTETKNDGVWSTTYASNGTLSLLVKHADPAEWWSWNVTFDASMLAQPLMAGVYERAVRSPFQSSGRPGLAVGVTGRGCNTLTGRFQIQELTIASDGTVTSVTATFEQHCEGWSEALRGCVHYEK